MLIPFCKVLGALGLVLAIMGLNMGAIDCLANLQMIQVYGNAVAPFLQAMHFFYGLGAFVSPMLAEPFLLEEDCTDLIVHHNVTNSSFTNSTHAPHAHAHTLEEAQGLTKVRYAFWLMSALQIPIPLLIGSLMWKQRQNPTTPSTSTAMGNNILAHDGNTATGKSDYEDIDKLKDSRPFWQPAVEYQHYRSGKFCGSSTAQVIIITLTTAAIMFIYDGLQSAYGGYVFTYAVKSIVDLNRTEGAYLNACFWGTFALGRLVSMILATRLTPIFMLLCNIVGCLLSNILMLALSHNHVALYIGTCFLGLFLSSVTPTALALAEQYIDVTSSVTTFCVVWAAVGEMLSPIIVSSMFVTLGPSSFLGFGNIVCLMSVFVFFTLWWVGRQTPKSKSAGQTSFVWCPMFCLRKGGATDEDGLVTTHVKYYTRMSESDSNIELANVAQTDAHQN